MKNKLLTFIIAAALSGSSMVSLADPASSQNDSTHNQSTADSDTAAHDKVGAILETLNIVNQSEINAADEALKRSSNDDVKKYAEMMKTDHSANLDATKKLSDQIDIKPVETSNTNALEKKEEDHLKKLEATSDQSFDKEYINSMVKGHQAVLNLIDNRLLPKANNSDLTSFLKDTRETVAHHLQAAQEIQKSLK